MVVTKVIQIKSDQSLDRAMKYIKDESKTVEKDSLHRAMEYIVDEAKTFTNASETITEFPHKVVDGKEVYQLISSYGVSHHSTATEEFEMTRMNAQMKFGKRGAGGDVLAHHIIQSFSPEDDLTPQEIHEIGRQTILELTGGQHEFIIATHIDRGHIHNHIIFNATNMVTLKKFRWQKGTKRSLAQISDKHAALAGAKILDERMRTSRREYVAYRKKHVFRYEIKERLDFLLKHSTSLEDFKEKATALDLEIDFSRKEVRYKLLVPLGGKYQERFARDRTLSRRGNYSLEGLEKKLAGNKATVLVDEIKAAYQAHQAEKAEDFEIRLIVHDWQVLEETEKGIYLEVEYGLANKGVVLVPARCVEKREDGSYDIFIQRNDWFYFTNRRDASKNKAIRGETLARQLSYDNGEQIVRKNPYISRMDQLVREFNFLNSHNVTDGKQFDALLERFREQVEATQDELERLDHRLADLQKVQSALLAMEEGSSTQKEVAQTILKRLGLDAHISKNEIDRLIQEVKLERKGLHYRFESITDNHKELSRIERNIHTREQQSRTKI